MYKVKTNLYVLYSREFGHVLNTLGTMEEMLSLQEDRHANNKAFSDEQVVPIFLTVSLSLGHIKTSCGLDLPEY